MATKGETSGIPVCDVVYNSGEWFKRVMDLEKVIPVMIEKKLLSRRQGKWVLKQSDPAENLLGTLKTLSPAKFITYLEILIELGSSEPVDMEGGTRTLMRIMTGSLERMKPDRGSELDLTIARFISITFPQIDETQTSDLVSDSGEGAISSTDATKVETDEQSREASDELLKLSLKGAVSVQSEGQTSASTATTLDERSNSPPSPPPCQIGATISDSFDSNGGMLYSPIHGVSVCIPPNAIPAHVKCYHLGMYFYLGGPFELSDGVVSCSVIVWFYQSPYFEFLEDVTVKIPHAAKINDYDNHDLCVLTWGENKNGPPYKLSSEISADFSDGYHAVFKVKHFCPHTVGKKNLKSSSRASLHRLGSRSKKQKKNGSNLKGLDRMNSDSLERSFDDDCATLVSPTSRSKSRAGNVTVERGEAMEVDLPETSVQESMDIDSSTTSCENDNKGNGGSSAIQFVMAKMMSTRPAETDWKVTCAACYNHPTGNWILRMCGEELYGRDCLDFKLSTSFQICDNFIPLRWQGGSRWCVSDIITDVISKENIECVPFNCSKTDFNEFIASGVYPPTITYPVQCNPGALGGQLYCRIEVEGAKTANGKPPFFILHSNHHTREGSILYTSSFLYGKDSAIVKALNSPMSDIIIDPREPDHIKFFADISFQITGVEPLCKVLELKEYQLHNIMMECKNNLVIYKYRLLTTWASGQDVTLSALKLALTRIGVKDIVLRDCSTVATIESASDLLISPHFDSIPLPRFSSSLSESASELEQFLLPELAYKLQCCWRSVGYLMGIPDTDLETIAQEEQTLYAQSLCMMEKGQKHCVTYGTLFKAIQCLFDHCPDRTNDAYHFVVSNIDQLYSEVKTNSNE